MLIPYKKQILSGIFRSTPKLSYTNTMRITYVTLNSLYFLMFTNDYINFKSISFKQICPKYFA